MDILVSTICQQALRLCGQIEAPGRSTGVEHAPEVLAFFNQMVDGWNAVRGSIYTNSIDRYALTPGQTSYFIGPTGDFVTTRPSRIYRANLVQTGTSPEVHLPMRILTDDEWADKIITEIPTTIPTQIYNDGASPDSKLYLWGYPTVANDLELFTPSLLSSTMLATDLLTLPEAYPRGFSYNLAIEIWPLYGKAKMNSKMYQAVERIARMSRAAISNANSPDMKSASDTAFMGGSGGWDYYDYLTGGIR